LKFPIDIEGAIDGVAKVTLKGGVVGKVTFTVVSVSFALAAITWTVQNIWLSFAALVTIFTLTFVTLWRLINFADRHPQAALLEGAEFLVHEQILHATKTIPVLPLNMVEQVQPEKIEGPAANIELAQVPDQEAPQLPTSGERI
jgi:hypothetical protein